MFIPLMKADAVQRLVYGSIDETPDRAREIMDYATAKPAFEEWSKSVFDASGGKSYGNVRAQHDGRRAAGLLKSISFDDEAKRIDFCAYIEDDQDWRKVESGVYTGFSPGGRYVKRWKDADLPDHNRYTPSVGELSVVDVPCIPSATFALIKADGTEESREFVLDKAYEPGNEATVERAEVLAKAAGKEGRKNDFLVKARAELIAENADAALAKMADDEDAGTVVVEEPKDDPVAKIEAALAKADAVKAPVENTDVAAPEQFKDLHKAGAALQHLAKSVIDQPLLEKGLYTLERVGCLLERIGEIASSVGWEEKAENDTDSKLPKMAVELVGKVRDFLIEMATEETAELLTSISANMPEFDLVITDGDDMELAVSIVDLVKADTDLMEKAGARNSKSDKAKIQSMHDNAVALGADCGAEANKDALAALEADRDRMAKALDSSVPKIEALTDKVEAALNDLVETKGELTKATARIAELEARPEMAKGAVFAVDKEADGGKLDDQPPAQPASLIAQARQIAARR
jgi:hypothetical protein